jgi:DNA-binding CsgD family transcriptional regulator
MAEAEFRQLDGAPDPEAWADAGRIWRELGRPWPLARCLLSEAEAILAARRSRIDATPPLVEAHAIATRLGAAPLVAACETLARLARIDLVPATESAADGRALAADAVAAGSPASFGLTHREREVLGLLVEGYSNRRIGDALFISESTAGVHVSNILGKLGVASRVEAAAIAVRVGLTD